MPSGRPLVPNVYCLRCYAGKEEQRGASSKNNTANGLPVLTTKLESHSRLTIEKKPACFA